MQMKVLVLYVVVQCVTYANEGPRVVCSCPVCVKYANNRPRFDVLISIAKQERSSKRFLLLLLRVYYFVIEIFISNLYLRINLFVNREMTTF